MVHTLTQLEWTSMLCGLLPQSQLVIILNTSVNHCTNSWVATWSKAVQWAVRGQDRHQIVPVCKLYMYYNIKSLHKKPVLCEQQRCRSAWPSCIWSVCFVTWANQVFLNSFIRWKEKVFKLSIWTYKLLRNNLIRGSLISVYSQCTISSSFGHCFCIMKMKL